MGPLRCSLRSHHSCSRLASARGCRLPRAVTRGHGLNVRAESLLFDDDPGAASRGPGSYILWDEPSRRSTVFDYKRWESHRDVGRYLRHMKGIFKSVTFTSLSSPLSFLTLNACLIALYQELVKTEMLPALLPDGVHFTDVPFELTSFALSLLLVFRTDASYSRWCSALSAWSAIRSSSKQLIRQTVHWVPDEDVRARIVRWTLAYSRALMAYLRDSGDGETQQHLVREELRCVLQPQELDALLSAGPNQPAMCIHVLMSIVSQTRLSESRQGEMLHELRCLYEPLATSQRLLRYPIPLSYTRHTSRFMITYLTALPLALYDDVDWAIIPVTAVISFLLLGIEECGVQIEEPFRLLPLQEMCEDITANVNNILAEAGTVRALAAGIAPGTTNGSANGAANGSANGEPNAEALQAEAVAANNGQAARRRRTNSNGAAGGMWDN